MEVIVINTTHPEIDIPAFYTIIPGTHFRERASAASIALFSCKHIVENSAPNNAVTQLKKAEILLPDKYYIKFYLGSSYLSMGEYNNALDYFKKSLTLDPVEQDLPSIYSYMGVCLKEMEKYEDALESLKKGQAVDNERTDIPNLMGFCYFKLKQHENAINAFEQVIKLNPSSAIDYANLATNHRELGNIEKAVLYYETALELDPEMEVAKDNLKKLKKDTPE